MMSILPWFFQMDNQPFYRLSYLLSVPFLMKFVLYPVPYQERNRLADLVKEETNTEDAIYAWDDTATLYRKSERLSPSAILSPCKLTSTVYIFFVYFIAHLLNWQFFDLNYIFP
ncbi:competence-induced protein Ccs4 [Streptococcus pneumoniae]|nr:competence-induced protein Ccs4 [Streptococcus pneumoniae]